MSGGRGPWEMQLLEWTANPGRKLGGEGGRRRRRRPWCWIEREIEGRMREGQRHGHYNYQLDAMMTCPCEKPSLPHFSLPPLTLFLSVSRCMWNQTWNEAKWIIMPGCCCCCSICKLNVWSMFFSVYMCLYPFEINFYTHYRYTVYVGYCRFRNDVNWNMHDAYICLWSLSPFF